MLVITGNQIMSEALTVVTPHLEQNSHHRTPHLLRHQKPMFAVPAKGVLKGMKSFADTAELKQLKLF